MKNILIISLLLVNSLFAQLFWQNPLPQSNNLLAVSMAEGRYAWAVGSGGTIIKSTDAGKSWTIKPINYENELKDVYFVDSQKGYVIGDSGFIARTTNGGNSWSKLNCGTIRGLNCIFFINSQTGWAGTDNGIILKTTNGGNTWVQVPTSSFDGIKDIHFIDENNGYAVNNDVYKTTDSGNSWERVYYSGFDGWQSVQMSTKDTVWIANGFSMKRSITGGTYWASDGPSADKVFFQNNLMGYSIDARDIYNEGSFDKTTDGGKTWEGVIVPKNLRDLSFSGKNGILVGDDGMILISSDNGDTWTEVKKGLEKNIFAISALNDQKAVAVGERNTILQTNDGGKTWSKRNTNDVFSLYALHYFDDENIWAVGEKGAIYKSSDSGLSWNYVSTGFTTDDLKSVYFLSRSTGFVLSGTTVYLTTDSGLNWNTYLRQPLQSGETFVKIKFKNQMEGVIVASGQNSQGEVIQVLYLTADSGVTWSQAGLLGWPNSVCFTDKSIYVVGRYRQEFQDEVLTINKTTDLGKTWIETKFELSPKEFRDIFFQDESNGWVVGDQGLALRTTDAGKNWFSIKSGTDHLLYSISGTTDNVWLVGQQGTILNNKTGGLLSDVPSMLSTPSSFVLSQNFPNPFNPNTMIQFTIPTESFVLLRIYNTLGQLIKTLENKSFGPGTYQTQFNAESLSSGIYLYSIEAVSLDGKQKTFQTKKMAYIK